MIKLILKTGLIILALAVLFIAWLVYKVYRPSPEEYLKKVVALSSKIEKNPMNAKLYVNRGKIYLERNAPSGIGLYIPINTAAHLNDFLLAEQDFEKAHSINPTSKEYELLLANTKVGRLMPELKSLRVLSDIDELTGNKDYGDGYVVARRGQKGDERNWNGQFLKEKDNLQEALTWLEVVLKHKKDWHLYRLYRGEIQFALMNKAEAYKDLSNAIDAASKERFNPEDGKIGCYYPRVVEYLYTRAACYLLDGNNEKALEDMNRAVKIWPYYADVYTKRAFAYNFIGEKKKAIEDLEEAKRQRPGSSKDYDRMAAFFHK